MCLKVFVKGDNVKYKQLKSSSMMGSAFQKVNPSVISKHDNRTEELIFQILILCNINPKKNQLLRAIFFDIAFQGLKELDSDSFLGVYVAYRSLKRTFK